MIRVGTRRSLLARTQAATVLTEIARRMPGIHFETHPIVTAGDRLETPLAEAGGKGLFVKELEEALLRKEIDLAVHSAKDLPAALAPGTEIGAFAGREDPADVLVTVRPADGLAALPSGARVGTGSLRRRVQILAARPDLVVEPLRGNVGTRLARLCERRVDAVVLAAAGLTRLRAAGALEPDQAGLACRVLPLGEILPAPGQGALALQIRRGDDAARACAAAVDDPLARQAVELERAFLRRAGGDCRTPLAAFAHVHGEAVTFVAAAWTPDGRRAVRAEARGHAAAAAASVFARLEEQGIREILPGWR